MVHFRLSTIALDNVHTYDRVTHFANFLVGYEIDFTGMIFLEIHKHAFGETTVLIFPCLIQ